MSLEELEQEADLGRWADATAEAMHDEMKVALEYAAINAHRLCPDVTALVYVDSDQGEVLIVDEVRCATHEADCPAMVRATEDPHHFNGAHLYPLHMDCMIPLVPLETEREHRHAPMTYVLDVATFAAQMALEEAEAAGPTTSEVLAANA